jgi:ABC-type Fe3+/spermidine/putrescine transport system ATPase subunit
MATVAVRPEKMRISGAEQAHSVGENSLRATVKEIVYAGAVSTYMLEGADGLTVKVLTQNRGSVAASPGDPVTLLWLPAQSVVVED